MFAAVFERLVCLFCVCALFSMCPFDSFVTGFVLSTGLLEPRREMFCPSVWVEVYARLFCVGLHYSCFQRLCYEEVFYFCWSFVLLLRSSLSLWQSSFILLNVAANVSVAVRAFQICALVLCSATHVPLIQWYSSILVVAALSSVLIYNVVSVMSSGGNGWCVDGGGMSGWRWGGWWDVVVWVVVR